MNIVVSGGGTAGHINPALALAEELIARGHTVRFAGTPDGIEARLAPQAGLEFVPFEAAGFNRNHPQTIFHALRLIARSTKKAQQWFADIKPDAVVCFGGYVCIPVGRAAAKGSIPLVVHEQNSVMGLANKYLAKSAAQVALTYAAAASALPDTCKPIITGNPVRRSICETTHSEGRSYTNIPNDAVMLTVFGGSLGARHINTAVVACKQALLAQDNVYVYHITGPKEKDTVEEALALTADERARWRVVGYEDRMGAVLAASDCVLSRAGATSLAEISALRLPALLVPFPYATADHQTQNARAFVEAGAAFTIDDASVETPAFSKLLIELVSSQETRRSMSHAAAQFETRDAAAKLADVVIDAASAR